MTDYLTAGRGLKTVFIGEILSIFIFIPLLGLLAGLAGLIVMLVGLNTAGKVAEGYRTAFLIAIGNIVVGLLSGFLSVLGILSTILSMVMVYLVCSTTADLLSSKGDAETAARGMFLWKLYLGCMVVSLICTILAYVPLINVLAGIASIVTIVVSLVGSILYLMFLYRASESLQS